MIFEKFKQNQFKMTLVLSMLSAILIFSCAKENGQDSTFTESEFQEDSKSLELNSTSTSVPKINEAQMVPQSNDSSPSLFSQNSGTSLNFYATQNAQTVKLICIPSSLAYLGFVVDNYNLKGFPQDGILYIDVLESDLLRQCESKLNQKGGHLQISKLGIRYNGRDFELKNMTTKLTPIKVTRHFIDSIVTPQIISLNIYCSLNNKKLTNLGGNSITFSGKSYFESSQNTIKNNFLFINLDRISIQNQGYKFGENSFADCMQNLYATSGNVVYPKIYFVDDPIPLFNNDKFLTKNNSQIPAHQNYSNLVCYFVDESGKLNWHWGFDFSNGLHKYQVLGQWDDGVFTTNEEKKNLEKICKKFSHKYAQESWKLFNVEVADNFWSWSSQIKFSSEQSFFYGLPFEKIVAFGDSIADNGESKKYSGLFTGRILNEPKFPYFAGRNTGGLTEVEDLANLYKMPLFNWANAKDDILEKRNILNSPLSIAVDKYLTEGSLWGGGANKNKTLYFIHVDGSFFTNTQDQPEDIFNNLSKDLKSALHKLVDSGATYIALPYPYSPKHIFKSMKQIDPSTYNKYSKQLYDVFDDVIASIQNDYGPQIQINGIQYQDLANSINQDPISYGFQNNTNPCYVASPLETNGTIVFETENVDSSVAKSVLCPKQSQYFYFDNVHPGSTANLTLAWYSAQYLQQAFSSLNEQNITVPFGPSDYLFKVFSDSNNSSLNFLLEKK